MNGFTRFLLGCSVVLGAIGGFLYFAFFDVWIVPGDDPQFGVSIEPTLTPGDLVLIARHGTPSVGNVVRCADPDEPRRWVVGRWSAGSGDHVSFNDEALFVNGSPFSSPRGCAKPPVKMTNPGSGLEETLTCRQIEIGGQTHEALFGPGQAEGQRALTVDPGRIFLVSDNRHMHLDSRDFGSIDPRSCQHVVFRLWGTSYYDASHRFTIIW